jgi:glutamyl-Q tRNA(Asp) synthetase
LPIAFYKGRFAPSPSGPLHLGSLFTALASYLQAHQQQGKWLVRMDDLDRFRVVKGAADSILKTLEAHGLLWDDAVLYQSRQKALYQQAIESLQSQSQLYGCNCSRKQLLAGNYGESTIHSGRCHQPAKMDSSSHHALRIKTKGRLIQFNDLLQGGVTQDIYNEVGDFILKRRDQVYSYHLATVVDDHFMGINEVLRGIDLIDSTPRQLFLQESLKFKRPLFAHIPILTNADGIKLSKRCLAEPVDNQNPEKSLFICLKLLDQSPPLSLSKANKKEILEWAIVNWNPLKLQGIKQLDYS